MAEPNLEAVAAGNAEVKGVSSGGARALGVVAAETFGPRPSAPRV